MRRTQSEPVSAPDLSRLFIELIPRAMWSIRFGMREASGKDLSIPQFRVMAQLWNRARTNGELAEAIGVSVPAMSRMVDGLVEAGYVQRGTQERADRRRVQLGLSPAGKRAFRKMQSHTQELFAERFAGLESARLRSLSDGLGVLQELFP